MAVLNATERAEISAVIQRWWSKYAETCGFTKTQLAAARDAADVWLDSQAAEYNAALPVEFRTAASALQKTLLLTYVLLQRVKRDGAAVGLPGSSL